MSMARMVGRGVGRVEGGGIGCRWEVNEGQGRKSKLWEQGGEQFLMGVTGQRVDRAGHTDGSDGRRDLPAHDATQSAPGRTSLRYPLLRAQYGVVYLSAACASGRMIWEDGRVGAEGEDRRGESRERRGRYRVCAAIRHPHHSLNTWRVEDVDGGRKEALTTSAIDEACEERV